MPNYNGNVDFAEAIFLSRYLELEIQNLLKETGDTALAADRLLRAIESDAEALADKSQIDCLAKFLLNCGFTSTLRDFCLRNLSNEHFPFPWPAFIEALALMNIELDEKTRQSLNKGIQELSLQNVLGISSSGEKIIPELRNWRNDYRYKVHKNFIENKKTQIENLKTLRIQRLVEKEKELLNKLFKVYPNDVDLKNELLEYRQRFAVEILAKRNPFYKTFIEKTEEAIEPSLKPSFDATMSSLKEAATSQPEMTYELAVFAWSMEGYHEGLEILEANPSEEPSYLWLKADFLLKTRRYVELLNELSLLELKFADDPETFFATAYLRAQAHWGLGQKSTAIEIMESLLASRPNYRSASSLLSVWKGPST